MRIALGVLLLVLVGCRTQSTKRPTSAYLLDGMLMDENEVFFRWIAPPETGTFFRTGRNRLGLEDALVN